MFDNYDTQFDSDFNDLVRGLLSETRGSTYDCDYQAEYGTCPGCRARKRLTTARTPKIRPHGPSMMLCDGTGMRPLEATDQGALMVLHGYFQHHLKVCTRIKDYIANPPQGLFAFESPIEFRYDADSKKSAFQQLYEATLHRMQMERVSWLHDINTLAQAIINARLLYGTE